MSIISEASVAFQEARRKALEAELIRMREANYGQEVPEEQQLIEDIVEVWFLLTEDEKQKIRLMGPLTKIA